MTRYEVAVPVTFTLTYQVDAESEQEARDTAVELCRVASGDRKSLKIVMEFENTADGPTVDGEVGAPVVTTTTEGQS